MDQDWELDIRSINTHYDFGISILTYSFRIFKMLIYGKPIVINI